MHTPKYTLRALLLGLALCSMPVGVLGQGSSVGAITGTVTDPSGSPIPAAQITLRNIQTNSARAEGQFFGGVYDSELARRDQNQPWFDTSVFSIPAAGTQGNISPYILSGPNFFNLDASLFRTIKWTERFNLEFRTEWLHPQILRNSIIPTQPWGI